MRTYRTYTHTYRPGRRGVIKTKPMKVESNCPTDTMHGILLGAAILVAALVVAVPHG
jgi:hypothetical protein